MFEFWTMSVNGSDGTSNTTENLGINTFRVPPSKGDFISFNDKDEIGQIFEVIAIIHPLELGSNNAGDLMLKYVSTNVDFRKGLRTMN